MSFTSAENLGSFIRQAVDRLAAAGVDNPSWDARLLIAQALGCDRLALIVQAERALSPQERRLATALIDRRCAREPVARILGVREFWGLPFALNEATLEPRPDSETLVELALQRFAAAPPRRVLDLGTGTGCLLLALLQSWPLATGLGVDRALRAVEQARNNAQALGLAQRAVFRQGDWLDGVAETFDVIVCNPPYIATGDLAALMPEVRDHDPSLALDGGVDGLAVYRALIPALPGVLTPGGAAIFEVGQGQSAAVCHFLQAAGFSGLQTQTDLAGVERCVLGRWQGSVSG